MTYSSSKHYFLKNVFIVDPRLLSTSLLANKQLKDKRWKYSLVLLCLVIIKKSQLWRRRYGRKVRKWLLLM